MLASSDFSALKNFVRKPVHENCLKFFQWFKITSNITSLPLMTCFLHRRYFFYLNPPVSNWTTESGRAARKLTSSHVFSLSVRSLRSMWWSRLACVLVARDDSTLLMRALKWILRILRWPSPILFFPVLSTTALDCCPVDIHLPAHTARATQNWLQTNCPYYIAKDQWPPNSSDLNPLNVSGNVGCLSQLHKRHPKPKTIAELKEVLQVIWDSLPHWPIDKAVKELSKSSQSD